LAVTKTPFLQLLSETFKGFLVPAPSFRNLDGIFIARANHYFWRFSPIIGKKFGVFLKKTIVTINVLHKLAVFSVKKPIFVNFLGENICKKT
jgi:hypothetical protein